MLTEENCRSLGFRAGLEIHQQLDTKHKLFCRCPVGYNSAEPDARIIRHMRPTLSELGEYDGTALMEFKTRKEVVYELFRNSMCTYEMDDTPPFLVNQEAIDIGIEIALLLNCSTVDEIHISRKQYLDGSIPTGFQRTAVIGVGGWVPFRGRKIRITQVNVEEDACREVSDKGHTIVWRTDRLSIPLVEVITGPDLRTPEEVSAVNALLGRILRSTGKVRRGIGAARQDINVSIDGGTRVEIKGVMRTGYGTALTAVEALRQKALLQLRDSLRARGVTEEAFSAEWADVTDLCETKAPPILEERVRAGERIGAVCVRGWRGLLAATMQPGRVFADEIAGRVRVIACLDGRPNLLHSDNAFVHGMTEEHWSKIKKAVRAGQEDSVVLTWGVERDMKTACEEIIERARAATIGVPNETRQALPGGITDFERILPGADRMYPDTDSPPTPVTEDRIRRIGAEIPGKLWEREEAYREMGLTQEESQEMSLSPWSEVFEEVVEARLLPARRAAAILIGRRKALKRAGVDVDRISPGALSGALGLLAKGKVSWLGFLEILKWCAADGQEDVEAIAAEHGLGIASEGEMKQVAEETVNSWDGLPAGNREAALRRLVGQAVYRLRFRGEGGRLRKNIGVLLERGGHANQRA